MEYKITDNDIENIKDLTYKTYNSYVNEERINAAYKVCKEIYNSELKEFDLLYHIDSNNTKKIYNYFINKRKINPYYYCEEKLKKSYINAGDYMSSGILDFFIKGVRKQLYKPSDNSITNIINASVYINKTMFNKLLTLSILTPKEDERVNNFLFVIKNKNKYELSSLEKIKLENIWKKNFNSSIHKEFDKIFYDLIPGIQNTSYLQEKQGYFYSVIVDCDKLSLINSFSMVRNQDYVRGFFREFSNFIHSNPDNYLELKSTRIIPPPIGVNENKWELFFHFNSEKSTVKHKSFIDKLIQNYVNTGSETNLLTQARDSNYIKSLVFKYHMENELSSTPEQKKLKL